MGVKLNRRKPRSFLLSVIYRLAKWLPVDRRRKLKLFLDLEWIFERLSHEYSFDHYAKFDHPVRVYTFSFLKEHITPAQSVFDMGCHAGDLSFLISSLAKNVTGIDYNEDWINAAKKAYPDVANLHFYKGEAYEYLTANSIHYDVLILSHILEHLDDPKIFLLRFASFFKFIYIELPDFEKTNLNLYRKDLGSTLIYTDADHVSEFDRDEIRSLLAECGITILNSENRHGLHRLWCATGNE